MTQYELTIEEINEIKQLTHDQDIIKEIKELNNWYNFELGMCSMDKRIINDSDHIELYARKQLFINETCKLSNGSEMCSFVNKFILLFNLLDIGKYEEFINVERGGCKEENKD